VAYKILPTITFCWECCGGLSCFFMLTGSKITLLYTQQICINWLLLLFVQIVEWVVQHCTIVSIQQRAEHMLPVLQKIGQHLLFNQTIWLERQHVQKEDNIFIIWLIDKQTKNIPRTKEERKKKSHLKIYILFSIFDPNW